MNKKYVPTIGIEIHTVLKTKTKMFSPARNIHDDQVNTYLNVIDLALPGTLPLPNEKAVQKGLILANALHMKMNYQPISFDRKNYFYWDLPKGFQITQQFFPIGHDGYIDVNNKHFRIERIHLEEDTAKQIKQNSEIWLNYNRAGLPLIEIVSKPDLHSAEDVYDYVSKIREILVFLEISDAKMEEGSLRCDLNISLAEENSKEFGTKVEIKNINSISNLITAANYEIERQSKLLNNNEIVEQQTRRFDDKTNTTIFMRKKGDSVDYRYMVEPNIMAINLEDEYVQKTLSGAKIHPDLIRQKLLEANLSITDINKIMNDYDLYQLIYKINLEIDDWKEINRWIINELMGLINKNKLTLSIINNDKANIIVQFIKDLKNNLFNSKQAKEIFECIIIKNEDYNNVIKKINQQKVNYSEQQLQTMIDQIINDQNLANDLANRYDRAEKFIMGQMMKQTKGNVAPDFIVSLIKKRK